VELVSEGAGVLDAGAAVSTGATYPEIRAGVEQFRKAARPGFACFPLMSTRLVTRTHEEGGQAASIDAGGRGNPGLEHGPSWLCANRSQGGHFRSLTTGR